LLTVESWKGYRSVLQLEFKLAQTPEHGQVFALVPIAIDSFLPKHFGFLATCFDLWL
jgi:hypothetical protein